MRVRQRALVRKEALRSKRNTNAGLPRPYPIQFPIDPPHGHFVPGRIDASVPGYELPLRKALLCS